MTQAAGLPAALGRAKERLEQADPHGAYLEVRRALDSGPCRGVEVAQLAAFAEKLATLGEPIPGLTPVRVAILGAYTTTSIVAAARCALLQAGFLATTYEAPFDAYRQEVLDPESQLWRFAPEAVLVAVGSCNLRWLPAADATGSAIESALERECTEQRRLWELLQARGVTRILQHDLEDRSERWLGPAERTLPGSASRLISEMNRRLREAAPPGVTWVEVDRLSAQVGRRNWFDPRLYHHGKLGFSPRHLAEYVQLLESAWRAATGTGKKCLVVDLDNTLWGGVIGDDGLDGIRLGPGDPEGEAFADFCHYLKGLLQRGVLLAVCSKNDPQIASQVFERHPGMPLELADFSSFRCSWSDKPSSLRQLARELNLGLDSLVYVDDNPAECDLVRRELPQVTVLALPQDPSQFRFSVDDRGLFAGAALTSEDLARARSYAARKEFELGRETATDLAGFLRELDMRGTFRQATPADLPRVAQLQGKTNQFNTTTRRYTQSQLDALLGTGDWRCFVVGLSDRHTDHGIVSTVLARTAGGDFFIDSWLMSCRVFSRTLEAFTLNALAGEAARLGLSRLVGEYVPTSANRVIEGLFRELGFRPLEADRAGFWQRDVGVAALPTHVREASA